MQNLLRENLTNRYVAIEPILEDPYYKYILSSRFLSRVSREITSRFYKKYSIKLEVSLENIINVIDSIIVNIPHIPEDSFFDLIVSTIVQTIEDEGDILKSNIELDPMVILRMPESGLSPISSSEIKLRKKGPTRGIINMNY